MRLILLISIVALALHWVCSHCCGELDLQIVLGEVEDNVEPAGASVVQSLVHSFGVPRRKGSNPSERTRQGCVGVACRVWPQGHSRKITIHLTAW